MILSVIKKTMDFRKRKFAAVIIVILISLTLPGLVRSTTESLEITSFPEKFLNNVTKKTLPDGSTAYAVGDINYAVNADPFTTDLLVKFDREPLKYIKDDSGKYDVYSAHYDFIRNGGGIGRGCASFYKSSHGFYVNTSEGLWLGSSEDLGSFNIELRFKPAGRSGGVLFSRTGYFSGEKKGIEIVLRNGKVIAYLNNIFLTPGGRLKSAVLTGRSEAGSSTWHHFSLSFDRISGRLAIYMDGEEDGVLYMTDTGAPESGVFKPLFGRFDAEDESIKGMELPFAVIGRNYTGLIDEFRISYTDYESLKRNRDIALSRHKGVSSSGRIPYNREGVITGDVSVFPTTGTAITDFSWDEVTPEGTFIWMEMRTSDKTFDPMDRSLKWNRIVKDQKGIFRAKGEDSLFLKGKYCQWRAHLVASPEGERTPLLKKIVIRYRPDPPPDIPVFLEVVENGDRYVVLRWKKNVEHDIAGYRVYYGIRKGSYEGILTFKNGQRISNSLSDGNYITLRIDEALIEENRGADKRGVLDYPALENTVLYYFSVTAYDSYRPDTSYNHESELSPHVTGRPFGGSEIR